MRQAFAASGLEGEVTPFIADMPAAFGEADLVVCRSGAGAVSELAAAGKPSILVPFPFAADDHQTRNAEAIERGGAARLVRDAEMNGERLYTLVRELAADGGRARADGRSGAPVRAARRGAAGGRDHGGGGAVVVRFGLCRPGRKAGKLKHAPPFRLTVAARAETI